MKALSKFRISGILALALSLPMVAQTILAPTGIIAPGHNQKFWDIPLNQNFALINNYFGGLTGIPSLFTIGTLGIGTGTVATMNTYTPAANAFFIATDATSPLTCGTTGGGGYKVLCQGNGSGWVAAYGGPGTSGSGYPGLVFAKNCGGSALQGVDNTGVFQCAASSTGGNGGIYNQTFVSSTAGNGTWQTVYTYTLLGNTLSTTGGIDVDCGYYINNQSAQYRVIFGSQEVGAFPYQPTNTSGPVEIHVRLYNQGATNSQWAYVDQFSNNSTQTSVNWFRFTQNNLSVDTTASQVIACQILQNTPGTWTGNGFTVDRIQQ